MIVKLLTEHLLEFLSLKGGCPGLSESTLVKIPHCWKSHVTAHFLYRYISETSHEPLVATIFEEPILFYIFADHLMIISAKLFSI